MKIITVNLSEPQVKALQVLQDLGMYPSRSEAIRVAIRDFLIEELEFGKPIEEVGKNKKNPEIKSELGKILKKLNEEPEVEICKLRP